MKRALVLIFCLIMMLSACLTACADTSADKTPETPNTPETQETTEPVITVNDSVIRIDERKPRDTDPICHDRKPMPKFCLQFSECFGL